MTTCLCETQGMCCYIEHIATTLVALTLSDIDVTHVDV